MKVLSEKLIKHKNYELKVIQFGEGNFIRAFFDAQIDKLNNNNVFNGSVCIIGPREFTNKVRELKKQDYLFTLIEQGIENNKQVKRTSVISAIQKGIDPYLEYKKFLELAKIDSIKIITSNTTEAGIVFNKNDKVYSENKAPVSFTAKLTALLYKRFLYNKNGFIILPLELIENNAKTLKEIVIKYAKYWGLENEFIIWLNKENIFINTLVDKIVPGIYKSLEMQKKVFRELNYIDNFLVVAEPYELFILETKNKDVINALPFSKLSKLNVIFTNDIKLYREQKVYLLNAPHTIMAILGLQMNIKTVLEFLEKHSQIVNDLIYKEIIPSLEYSQKNLKKYANSVIERYKNPFNEHLLKSISLNSISKFKSRVIPIIIKRNNAKMKLPKIILLSLAVLIKLYKDQNIKISDNKELVDIIRNSNDLEQILCSKILWGADLTKIDNLYKTVKKYYEQINNKSVSDIIKI